MTFIPLRLQVKSGPSLKERLDINEDGSHVPGGVPVAELEDLHGGHSKHHGSLEPGTNDFDQWREEWVEVHGEVQLKFDVVVIKLFLKLLKVFVEGAEAGKKAAITVKFQFWEFILHYFLPIFCEVAKFNVPLENVVINRVGLDPGVIFGFHDEHEVVG